MRNWAGGKTAGSGRGKSDGRRRNLRHSPKGEAQLTPGRKHLQGRENELEKVGLQL